MAIKIYPPQVFTVQSAVLAADFPKVNQTFANVTDLTLNLTAGHWYQITTQLIAVSVAGGAKIDFAGGSVTATGIDGSAFIYDQDGGTGLATRITTLNTSTLTSSGNDVTTFTIDFTIQVNAGGTLIPRFAQASTNAAGTILPKYSTITAQDVTP